MNDCGRQLDLFGLQAGEDEFVSERWGRLTFYPSESERWTDTCRHCLLWVRKDERRDDDECLRAPCSGCDRRDGRNGFFGIMEMPRLLEDNV